MSNIWADEDIADNWLVLDIDALKKEIEREGGKWNLDGYCKGFINEPRIKLPFAYVDKHGKLFFNETAKKWENPEEIQPRLIEYWAMEGKPILVLLTRSLKELAEFELSDTFSMTLDAPKKSGK